MNISLNWLRDYVSYNCTTEELAQKLTMAGLEVEEIITNEKLFSGVIVGKVLTVEKHPNADKLKICKVDSGTEVYNVICGAPNVSEGQIVPFAKPGAKIGSEKLKSVKIRGVRSDGMICSEKELGLSDDHSGIMVLNETEWEPGQEFNPVLDNDTVFVINITPNRPDCLSHIGVAREVAAITGAELKIPETQINETDVPVEEKVEVEIQDPEGCPRYCVRVIENIEIKESPLWLKKRLEAVGVRSINNVVDITNYVLMETGHPLHAFDYDFIEGHKIVVRKANDNEKFVTLDNIERQLVKSDLLICDGKKPVALAGVMGGLNSEVINTTKTVIATAKNAWFKATSAPIKKVSANATDVVTPGSLKREYLTKL